ncbi:methyltransferase FkbM [Helicobacter sp. MIT 21-1697]|uniref:methyltransferase FkbM n=1 Tax=Helicobacter sp. MIT 21-1697 TaxID=2993733 RepID=UPI00224A8D02|nr:methyltransferase FkbM [Helicobacter sp. MIT 21-1697]MCX2716541.1 methyltransferase FkbM [Helicobacter sp. MIT 21-1697]
MYQIMSEPYICKNPVLLLFFNRLDTLTQTLSQLAKVKPPRMYLAGDGARNEEEHNRIKAIREFLLQNITWECEIHTRFLDYNLGCKMAVSSSITWFFSCESQGIILEDDCLPNISFFRFCDELLEKYKMQQKVFMISGWSALDFAQNPSVETLSPKAQLQEDYYFSKYNHIWGWASWSRAWQNYQLELDTNEFKILNNFCSKNEKNKWYKIIKNYAQGKIDTWDYPWTYSIWKANGLCIYPKANMILNIGLNRADATHTTGDSKFASMPTYELSFPLKHPTIINQNKDIDKVNFKIIFDVTPIYKRLYSKCKKFLIKLTCKTKRKEQL